MKWSRRRLMPGENERMAQQIERVVRPDGADDGPNSAWFALAAIGVVACAAWGLTGGILALFDVTATTVESSSLAAAVVAGGGTALWLTRLKDSDEREAGAHARMLATADEIQTVSLQVRRAWHIPASPDWRWLLLESDDGRYVLCTCDFVQGDRIDEPRRSVVVEFFPPDDGSIANVIWSGATLDTPVGEIAPDVGDLFERPKEFLVYEFDQLPKEWQRQIRAA